jgi:hypothetical protein
MEVLAQGVTDASGMVDLRIQVPEWVETDRSYLIVVTDLGYQPLAEATFFHPTTPDGRLTRTGRIQVVGPCTLLVANDRRYVLYGEADALQRLPRDRDVEVTGRAEPGGACVGELTGSGIAIRVGGGRLAAR